MLWTAIKSDVAHRSGDEKERQAADDLLGLMTPIIKGVLTDKGFDHAVMAQQVFGGHGYIEEHGMSQFVRDARIAMIYEGANGIQALDLVGRKLALNGGRAVQAFFKEVGEFCEENRADEKMAPFTKAAEEGPERPAGRDHVADAERHGRSPTMPAPPRPTTCISSASSRSATCGRRWRGLRRRSWRRAPTAPPPSTTNKLVTGRFFMERVMPETAAHLARISSGADTMMALPAEAF